MRKILIITLLLCTNLAKADFIPIDFVSMVHRAHKIAYGEIICVDENVFELKIDKSLNPIDKVLTINKFPDWTCAIRWSKYFVGQEIMVFLTRNENGFIPIGAGNEGEMPIFKDNVYPSSMTWRFNFGDIKRFEPKPEHKKFDADMYSGIKLKLDFLWKYIEILKECFEFNVVNRKVKSAEWICSKEKACEFKKSSKLHSLTFQRLKIDLDNTN